MFQRFSKIQSCYLGPDISPEHFISEHFFLFLLKGKIEGFDGHQKHFLEAGEACLITKNSLARYSKYPEEGDFKKVVVIFDTPFLKNYQAKHAIKDQTPREKPTFVRIQNKENVLSFIDTLAELASTESSTDKQREVLLDHLLENQPELMPILFDFLKPRKIDLEAFMNQHYKFKASLSQLAFLSGRSLSSFKRDFKAIFHETPNRWLMHRRLQEAHFLLQQASKSSSEIYLDLGFEDISHFSYSFKKKFGYSPSNTPKT